MPPPPLAMKNKLPLPLLYLKFTAFPRESIIESITHCDEYALLATGNYELQEWKHLLPGSSTPLYKLRDDKNLPTPDDKVLLMKSLPPVSSLSHHSLLDKTIVIMLHPDRLLRLKNKEYRNWEKIISSRKALKIKKKSLIKLLYKTEKRSYTERVLFSSIRSIAMDLSIDQIHSIVTGLHKKEAHYPGFASLRGTGKSRILDSIYDLINSGVLSWQNRKLKISGIGKR